MTEAPALSVRGVTKRYHAVAAVADFSIDIAAGEFITLLGPSGSGKSTVLSMIAGFTRPDSGTIRLRGADITGWSPERRAFGMVYQGYALFPHMSVGENVAFGLRMRGRPKAEIAARVASLLGRVRLTGMEDRLPRQLSGGQQQRVALARAIAFEPNLLLLDEPLSALDRQLRAEVQRELRELNRDLGLTFIFVTHDQDEALSLSDRVAVMNEGRLVQVGSPDALYERPANRFIAGFLGQSNFIEAEVEERRGGDIAVTCGPWRLIAPAAAGAVAGAAVTLVLRPERIEPGRSGTGWNSVTGIVTARTYLGASVGLEVQVEGIGPLLVTLPAWSRGSGPEAGSNRSMPAPGEPIALGWPCHAASVLDEAARA